jgi:hypothetical protein
VSLYRIKLPLKWVKLGGGCWVCKTICGHIEVNGSPPEGFWACGQEWIPSGGAKFSTANEAKAAAESYYRSRLLGALEPATEQDDDAEAQRRRDECIGRTTDIH